MLGAYCGLMHIVILCDRDISPTRNLPSITHILEAEQMLLGPGAILGSLLPATPCPWPLFRSSHGAPLSHTTVPPSSLGAEFPLPLWLGVPALPFFATEWGSGWIGPLLASASFLPEKGWDHSQAGPSCRKRAVGWKVICKSKAMIIYLTGTAACGKECNLVILLWKSDPRLSTLLELAKGHPPLLFPSPHHALSCTFPGIPAFLHLCAL